VTKNFPMTWDDWKGGVENAYQALAEFEERIAQGEVLSNKDQLLLDRLREVTAKYPQSGQKKPSKKSRPR
jgi:hypothetical protein